MPALILLGAVVIGLLWFALSPLFGRIGTKLSNRWTKLFGNDKKDEED